MPSVRAYSPVAKREDTEETVPEVREETAPEEEDEFALYGGHEIEDWRTVAPMRTITPPPEKEEVRIPWSEVQLLEVFKKFSDSDQREVHIEELPSLLRYLGARTTDTEVDAIVRKQTMYSSLHWFEFIEFIKRHREYDVKQLRDQFESADIDGNGTLDIEELHQLLVKSGYSPTKEATQEALNTIDEDHDGTVSFEEFEMLREHLRSTRGFLKSEAAELGMLFERIATGENGLLPTDQLWRICAYIGYNVAPESLRKSILNVDKDHSGFISYDELLGIIRSIRDCEGERLLDVISGYAAWGDEDGEQADKSDKADVKVVAPSEIPSDGEQSLRSISRSSEQVRKPSKEHGRKPSKRKTYAKRATIVVPTTLRLTNLAPALAQLGYFVSPDVTEYILETKLADREKPDRLKWDELAMFLRAYRRTEGFTKKELAHLKECFDREQAVSVAGDDDEGLDALELGRVLRCFGISRTLQQVQRMIEEIDFDGSGQLEFAEFTKLMRQLFHEEAAQRRNVFGSLDTNKNGWINVVRVEEAMTMINGAPPDNEMVQEALWNSLGKRMGDSHGEEDLTIAEFEKFFSTYRKLLMESVAAHAGFVPVEVDMLHKVFAQYDVSQTDYLEPTELRAVVRDLIPEAMETPEGRLEVQKMLEHLAPDEAGLDFSGFLWLMRKCHDQRDERDILKETEVVKLCEYTPEEVEGLRQLFSSHINWAGEVSLETLVDLFGRITTVSEADEDELGLLLYEVCKTPLNCRTMRFPNFMLFMRHLVQFNLFGLNEAADRAIRRQQPKKPRNRGKVAIDKKRRGGMMENVPASQLQQQFSEMIRDRP